MKKKIKKRKKNQPKVSPASAMLKALRAGKIFRRARKAKLAQVAKAINIAVEPGTDEVKKTKIKIIGIGGGGGNIVSEIASRIKGVSFLVANTDSQALKAVKNKVGVFQFGESFTHGLGTGMNPEIAAAAAISSRDKIKKILTGQDLVILVATLGGGAGSGSASVFAKISQSLGNLTLGIFTMPFKFEGDKKMEIANAALERLKPKLSCYTVVPNERIFQIVEKATPLVKAFSAINKILAQSLEGLIEAVFEPGLINIDFADLKTIFSGQGRLAYLNSVAVGKSEGSIKETAEKVLNSPLYPYNIRGAKGVLFNISGGSDLTLSEVGQISQTISNLVNKEARIIFGISQGKEYQNVVKTTVLATGCALRNNSLDLDKRKVFSKKKESVPAVISPLSPRKRKSVKEKPPAPKKEQAVEEETEKIKLEIRKNALQLKEETKAEEQAIEAKEKFWETPAFLRKEKD